MKKLVSLLLILSCNQKTPSSEPNDLGLANVCNFDKVPNPNRTDFITRAKSVVGIKLPVGQATGFLFNEDGYIVTNRHVAKECTVKLNHGKTICKDTLVRIPQFISCKNKVPTIEYKIFHEIEIVFPITESQKSNLDSDMAIFKIDPQERGMAKTPFLRFSKAAPQIGDHMYILGNPGRKDGDEDLPALIAKINRSVALQNSFVTVCEGRNSSHPCEQPQREIEINALLIKDLTKKIGTIQNAIKNSNLSKEDLKHFEVRLHVLEFTLAKLSAAKAGDTDSHHFLDTAIALSTKYKSDIRDTLLYFIRTSSSLPFKHAFPDKTLRLSTGKILSQEKNISDHYAPLFNESEAKIVSEMLRTQKINLSPTKDIDLILKLAKANRSVDYDINSQENAGFALAIIASPQMNPLLIRNAEEWFFDNTDLVTFLDTQVKNSELFYSGEKDKIFNINEESIDEIRTNAEAHPGSSGSPILNENGLVIGVLHSVNHGSMLPIWQDWQSSYGVSKTKIINTIEELNQQRINENKENILYYQE